MPNDLQNRIREVLREQADKQPFVPSEAGVTAKQAKRRLVRNGVGAGVLAFVLALGAIGAIGSVLNARSPKPANNPTPGVVPSGRLAFIVQGTGIYVMDVPGLPRLVSRAAEFAGWFPDGDSLLVARGSGRATTLYRVSASGRGLVAIHIGQSRPNAVSLHGWQLTDQPALSPDGTQLVFGGIRSATFGGGQGLFITDLGGGPGHQIYHGNPWGLEPAWSPDGTKIAFSGSLDGETSQILVVGTDGQDLHALPLPPHGHVAGEPTWSPDGARIAMSVEMHVGGTVESYIYLADADGSHLTQLTSESSGSPSWSPDGKTIAFVSPGSLLPSWAPRGDGYDIVAIDIATSTISPVALGSGQQLGPRWWVPRQA